MAGLLRLAVDRGYDQQAVHLAGAVAHFQNGRNAPEQVETAELALTAAERLGTPGALGTAYYLMGNAYLLRRLDFATAIEWHQKALPMAEAADDLRLLAVTYTAMSKDYVRLSDRQKSRDDWEQALNVSGMATGDRAAEIRALLAGLNQPAS